MCAGENKSISINIFGGKSRLFLEDNIRLTGDMKNPNRMGLSGFSYRIPGFGALLGNRTSHTSMWDHIHVFLPSPESHRYSYGAEKARPK